MTAAAEVLAIWTALTVAGFLGHLAGDFLLQSDWMARNKHRPLTEPGVLLAMVTHAGGWGLALAAAWLPVAWVAWGADRLGGVVLVIMVLTFVHGVQDRRWPVLAWMRLVGQDPEASPWLVTVTDGVWHLLQITIAAVILVAWFGPPL